VPKEQGLRFSIIQDLTIVDDILTEEYIDKYFIYVILILIAILNLCLLLLLQKPEKEEVDL